jgi:DNA invertase Pin-like site-specific DNA recombinase
MKESLSYPMMMQMVGSFAEFERTMLHERTRNGLEAACKQGLIGGRRPKLKTHQQEEIVKLVSSGQKNGFCGLPDVT